MMRREAVSTGDVERQLETHARMDRAALPDAFAQQTMAKVRIGKARASQREIMPAHHVHFAPAAIALAGFVIIAALVAPHFMPRAVQPNASLDDGTQVAAEHPTPPTPHNAQPAPPLFVVRTVSIDKSLVAPFRSEADALLERGRDLGSAMLSALPARPRAWAEPLENPPSR